MKQLLVRSGKRVVLVDTGIGDKWGPKDVDIFAIDHTRSTIDTELARLGLTRADVTDVILTWSVISIPGRHHNRRNAPALHSRGREPSTNASCLLDVD